MRRWLFYRHWGVRLAGSDLQMVCPKMNYQLIGAHDGLLAAALQAFLAFLNAIKACQGGSVSKRFCDQALKIPMVHLHNVADDLFLGV